MNDAADKQKTLDTALWLAVCNADDAAIARFLAAGANPNVKADGDRSALSEAVQLMMFDVADTLLAHGGDVNYQPEPRISRPLLASAMFRDVCTGSTARVRYLLGKGADHAVRFTWSDQPECTLPQMMRRLSVFMNASEKETMREIEAIFSTHADALTRNVQARLVRRSKQGKLQL